MDLSAMCNDDDNNVHRWDAWANVCTPLFKLADTSNTLVQIHANKQTYTHLWVPNECSSHSFADNKHLTMQSHSFMTSIFLNKKRNKNSSAQKFRHQHHSQLIHVILANRMDIKRWMKEIHLQRQNEYLKKKNKNETTNRKNITNK